MQAAAQALLELALAAGGHDNIGIELARISAPPVAFLPAPHPPRRTRFIEFLALGLLAVAALGALSYFAMKAPWIKALLHSHWHAQPAQADSVSPPAPLLSYAVVLGPGANSSNLSAVTGWIPAELKPDKQPSCQELTGKAKEITVYYKELPPVERFIEGNRSFFQRPHGLRDQRAG